MSGFCLLEQWLPIGAGGPGARARLLWSGAERPHEALGDQPQLAGAGAGGGAAPALVPAPASGILFSPWRPPGRRCPPPPPTPAPEQRLLEAPPNPCQPSSLSPIAKFVGLYKGSGAGVSAMYICGAGRGEVGIRNLAPLHVSVGAGSSPDPARTPEIDSILSATNREQILAALRLLDLPEIAKRLGYLDEITGDDDPEEPPMELSSLRQCALFFASEPRRSTGDIGISPDGILQASWPARGGGIVAIRFFPNGFLQFAAVSESGVTAERRRVHGTLPRDDALRAVKPFFPERVP